MGLYESVRVAREDAAAARAIGISGADDAASGSGAQLYAPHLPPSALAEGVAAGELIQGTLRISKHLPEEAVVRAGGVMESSGGGGGGSGGGGGGGGGVGLDDVLIPSRTLRNRAFDGDVVVVRMLPRHRWVAAQSHSLIATKALEDDEADDDAREQALSLDGEAGGGASLDESRQLSATQPISGRGSGRLVPTGEVVGITRPRGIDFVAVIAEHEERDIAAHPHRKSSNSVIAVPMDRRAPKVRLLTRRAKELLGQRLLVRVDRWRMGSRQPEAHVVRVLGPAGDIDAEMAALLAEYQIPSAGFSPGALAQLPREGAAWAVPPRELLRRRDLRNVRTCSIDPPGCTDVDDAVSVHALPPGAGGAPGGWEVGVHIADVSHFVPEGSLLDLEARARGTTVYLVDRRSAVLPWTLHLKP